MEGFLKKSILILEDETAIATFLRIVLERNGFAVFEAVTAGEAITIFENDSTVIDLLISDVNLEGHTDGVEIATRLYALRPKVPVLFISGFSVQDLVSRGLLDLEKIPCRRVSFIQKPFPPSVLIARVRELVPLEVETYRAGS